MNKHNQTPGDTPAGGQNRGEHSPLAAESRSVWNQLAGWWDEQMPDRGSAIQETILLPALDRLLEFTPGQEILDIACGNGLLARRLAGRGARVTAFDFSDVFIERARRRAAGTNPPIEFHVADATDREQLRRLGERRFHAAVCNMALMDLAEIEPLFETLPRLLRPSAHFVFTMIHPRHSPFVRGLGSRVAGDATGPDLRPDADPTVSQVLRIIGLKGQPILHYYFHRSLDSILQTAAKAGFALEQMEEPILKELDERLYPPAWKIYREVPLLLIARLRVKS